MSVNKATLLRAIAQDAVYGLRNKRGTLVDQFATRHTVTDVKGSFRIYKTKSMIPSMDANTDLYTALRSSLRDSNFEMGSADYNLKNFGNKIMMDVAELRDLDAFAGEASAVLEKVMAYGDAALDRYTRAQLASTSLNESEAVNNGVWTLANSTPALDIQEAANLTPGADTVVMGLDIAQILGRHPNFKEGQSHYSGSGFSSFQSVREGVAMAAGLDPSRVFIGENAYNSANPGQTLSLVPSLYNGLFWIGHQEGLCLAESGYEESDQANAGTLTIDQEANLITYSYFRACDFVRAEKELGCVITGVK